MSKRQRNRIVLQDFKAKKEDEGAIDIELSDGYVLTIPPPEFWSDAVLEAGEDHVAAATALIGPDNYARLVADGGSAVSLLAILQAAKEAEGDDLGES